MRLQNLPKSGHDDDIWLPVAQRSGSFFAAQGFGLVDGDVGVDGRYLYRWRLWLAASSRRAVRLGDNTDNLLRLNEFL
jgi:hypothetical protein